jgi:phosphatidylserine/phosphatidylglycerophosphate/cardiolipin synthase-like enzyme
VDAAMSPTVARPPIPLFPATVARPLGGMDLATSLLGDAERAVWRLWISAFLVGFGTPLPDPTVTALLDAVVRAGRRGVDVRLLMDDFTTGTEHARANAPAAWWLVDRKVPVRVHVPVARHEASHSKYLILDDLAVTVGSANLTPGGLGGNVELSLRVESPDLARDLARRFGEAWDRATPWE